MKPFVLFAMLTACATLAKSQASNLLLYDNFTGNTNSWATNTTGDAVYTVSNGKYVMENFDTRLRWSGIHVKLNSNSDYTISCLTTHTSGVKESGYGLMFGGLDNDNYYVFDIANSGYYRLYSKKNGVISYFVDWTKTSYVNQDNYKDNTIKLEHAGSTWSMYINGTWVNSFKADDFFGDMIGFIKSGNQRIEFDNLTVYGSASTSSNSSSSSSLLYNLFSDTKLNDNDNGSRFTFEDDFSEAKDEWGDNDDDLGWLSDLPYTSIEDDVLTLRTYKDKKISRHMASDLDTKKAFTITVELNRISGAATNASYGIGIEAEDGKAGARFYISANGYYAIRVLQADGTTSGEWKTTSAVKQGVANNTVKIESDGSFWSMYVNGSYVGLIMAKSVLHPDIHLISNDDVLVECDNFKMTGTVKK